MIHDKTEEKIYELYLLMSQDTGLTECSDILCDDEECVIYRALKQWYIMYGISYERAIKLKEIGI
jgi:hypothetical protein